jgi:hypothetical protein
VTLPTPDLEFSCCATRRLPGPLHLEAAWAAAVARPENAPGLVAMAYSLPHDEPLPPQSITFLKGKFWPNGTRLKVAFSGGNSATNAKVLRYAAMWSKYANIDFLDVGTGDAWDVLVGYGQLGYWSMVGTDSRFARQQGGTSLNLQGFDSGRMPESEWSRVVCHEFGHALGALHEQARPEVVARLDPSACYSYFLRTQGWSRQTVDDQILSPLDPGTTVESVEDDTSIMMYNFPKEVTKDHRPIAGGTKINELDGQTIALVYPGRGPVHPAFPSFLDGL